MPVTHGLTRKCPEYSTWRGMIDRCTRQNSIAYKDYGGRGIKVCERWRESFQNFLDDMGKRPSSKHTIERSDNSRGYGPDNCCWATREQQGSNTRRNRVLVHNGRTRTLAQWAKETGLSGSLIAWRLEAGWPVEDALTKPLGEPHRNYRLVECDGEMVPIKEAARRRGLPYDTLFKRASAGWSLEDALTRPVRKHCRRHMGRIYDRQ